MTIRPNCIKHQKQPGINDCLATCAAMITGKEVKLVLEDLSDIGDHSPHFINQIIKYLVRKNYYMYRRDFLVDHEVGTDVIFMGVSPASKGFMHSALFYYNEDGLCYEFDPNKNHGPLLNKDTRYESIYSFYNCK